MSGRSAFKLPQTASVGLPAIELQQNHDCNNGSSTSTTDYHYRTTTTPTSTSNGLTLNSLAHLNATDAALTIGQAAGQSAADRQLDEDPAGPAHSSVGRTGGFAEDRRKNSGSDGVVPDRRCDGHRKLAGKYAIPVSGRRREYQGEAYGSLRPRRDAEARVEAISSDRRYVESWAELTSRSLRSASWTRRFV